MRKDDRKIWNTSARIVYDTFRNGQYTNEFGEMEDLGIGSTHPTGRERGFASNLPSVIRAKKMFAEKCRLAKEKRNGQYKV